MSKVKEVSKYKIVRNWSNAFAQDCYTLDNGTTMYIDYDRKHITFEFE